jgi:hypothetical protein
VISFDSVANHMHVDTKVLSGYMSSIGIQAPNLKTLIERDYDRRVYQVARDAAVAIMEAIARYEQGTSAV